MSLTMELDPVFLSHVQFAFIASIYTIFASFTIGLVTWLATIEGVGLATLIAHPSLSLGRVCGGRRSTPAIEADATRHFDQEDHLRCALEE
jgi:hypothetical protein